MSNIVLNPKWNTSINQVENGELISGGPDGNANLATKQLAENLWYLKDKTENDLLLKADKNSVYTKTEADGNFAQKATTLTGYGITNAYTKSEIDTNYGGVKTLYDKNVAAGAGANGWTTDLVVENGLTQKQINAAQKLNNDGIAQVADLSSIKNPYTGQRVFVKSYTANKNTGGGTFVYDATKANVNDGYAIFNGWVRLFDGGVRVEYFGAIGDGVTDDSDAIQRAVTFANSTAKCHLIFDKTYLITKQISTGTFYGFTSTSIGKIIVNMATDEAVFKFSGASPNVMLERLVFEYKSTTATNKATFYFEFAYSIAGLKVDRLNLNGFKDCGWTFLQLKSTGNGGFFGGFVFSNVRSYYMYCDVMYDVTSWANSALFLNNFKFYGNYGLWVRTDAKLYNVTILNWFGQEVATNIIRADGYLSNSKIEQMVNWDTNAPAIFLSQYTKSNTISKVYNFTISDVGYCNHIDTSDNLYVSNVGTAISSSVFLEDAKFSEIDFKKIFPTITKTGDTLTKSGIVNYFGYGLKQNAFWLQTNPANPSATPPTTAGSIYLDTLDTVQIGSAVGGKYDRFSPVRMFVDFSIASTDIDDRAFEIGIGYPDKVTAPKARHILTNVGGRLKFLYLYWDGTTVTELFDIAALATGRYQMQVYVGADAGLSYLHVNGAFVGTFNTVATDKRPIISVKSVTKTTTIGLLQCQIRNPLSAQLK